MQAFVGCKIILAEEMSKGQFDFRKSNLLNADFMAKMDLPPYDDCTPGYVVVYPNPDGSKYYAWSPKDVFERAYRRIYTDEKELISTY